MPAARPVLPLFLSLLMAGALGGCQFTASGRALDQRLGTSLTRLWHNTLTIAGAEVGRPRRMMETVQSYAVSPAVRVRRLLTTAGRGGLRIRKNLADLSTGAVELATANLSGSLRRVADLTRSDGRLAREFAPDRLLDGLRTAARGIMRWPDFGHPLLVGPGDPYRSSDPAVVHRQETWVERLLRRF